MNENTNKLRKLWDETTGTTVTFVLGDWSRVTDVAKYPGGDALAVGTLALACALHGVSQKAGDAAAGKSGSEAVGAIEKVLDTLEGGLWTRGREAGGPRVTIFVRAAARMYGVEVTDDFVTKMDELPDATKAEVKAHAKYKKALAEIKAEDAAKALEAATKAADEAPMPTL